ncbi:MAG: gas vesicle protein GvpD P-loop domain-containing protein, partial [Candidatus Helarchaeota archaeon]
LEILKDMKNPIYISTRINPDLLYKQFPWITPILKRENIIDATTSTLIKSNGERNNHDFLNSLKLQNLPDFVKSLFTKIESTASGTIVIDSWDAIANLGETVWNKSNTVLANYLLEMVRETDYNLILILETQDNSYLDYLVDGIICLKKQLINEGQRVRHIHLNKLRGIQIKHPFYLFSLHKGRFTSFEPTKIQQIVPRSKIKIYEDPPDLFASGIPDLDRLLDGGFYSGILILDEVHPYYGSVHSVFLCRMILQFLFKNRGVLAVPPPGREYANIANFIQQKVEQEVFERKFRHIIIGPEGDLQPYSLRIVPKSHNDFFHAIRNFTREVKDASPENPNLILLSIDYIAHNFDLTEVTRDLPRLVLSLKKEGDIIIFTSYMNNPLIDLIKLEVQNHFCITEISGKAVFFAKKPLTNIFAMNFATVEDLFHIDLIPIV